MFFCFLTVYTDKVVTTYPKRYDILRKIHYKLYLGMDVKVTSQILTKILQMPGIYNMFNQTSSRIIFR